MDELRFAFRRLAARPGPSVVSIVTLACAIGAALATTSLLVAVVLRPIHVDHPERLHIVGTVSTVGGASRVAESHVYPFYRNLREQGGIFDGIAAGGRGPQAVAVRINGATTQVPVYLASHDWFDVVGVPFEIGRAFTSDEDRIGGPLVAILSEQYWRRTFNSDRAALGRAIGIQGHAATIVGVIDGAFRGLSLTATPDVYLPLHAVSHVGRPFQNYFAEPGHSSSPTAWLTIVARVPADSSPSHAVARLSAFNERRPESPRFVLTDISTAALPANARATIHQFTRMLAATVGLLLLRTLADAETRWHAYIDTQ